MTAISSLLSSLESILGIRQQIGADLRKAYIITRTWSGAEIGDGTPTETVTEILPTPGIKDFSHSIKLEASGNIKQGDIILHQISKAAFPLESSIDGTSASAQIEKLYKVGEYYYRAISIVEKHLTWNVQLRRLSDQTRRDT